MWKNKEQCAAFAIRNRLNGLCGCGRPHSDSSVTCSECANGNRIRMQSIRRKRVGDGCCPDCGIRCVGYRCALHTEERRQIRRRSATND